MFLQSKLDLLCQQIKVEKSMNRLTFIGSIQLNSPSTGGGVQTKNQHLYGSEIGKTGRPLSSGGRLLFQK